MEKQRNQKYNGLPGRLLSGPGKIQRLLFISTNPVWGGSEFLWFKVAMRLARAGNVKIGFTSSYFVDEPLHRDELTAVGAEFLSLGDGGHVKRLTRWKTLANRLLPTSRQFHSRIVSSVSVLDAYRPDVVVLSNGSFGQAVSWSTALSDRAIPYVVVEQLVAEFFQMLIGDVKALRQCHSQACMNIFVSGANVQLATALLGMQIPNVRVTHNPMKYPVKQHLLAGSVDEMRIACVARLHAFHKGQDLLLRVLAQPKWRNRLLKVSLVGDGPSREVLQDYARLLKLDCVNFVGPVDDVESVYRDHEVVVLPSRMEGQSNVLIEAMMSGRICVVTDVGGAKELIVDGVNGFLAESPTEDSLERALERAWCARAAWPQISAAAARDIRCWYKGDPIDGFISLLAEAFGDVTLVEK